MLNPNSEVYSTPSPTMPRDLHGRRGRNILEPKRVGEIRAEDISTPQGLCVTTHKAYKCSSQPQLSRKGSRSA